jgi:hypothetical protein
MESGPLRKRNEAAPLIANLVAISSKKTKIDSKASLSELLLMGGNLSHQLGHLLLLHGYVAFL